MSRLKGPVLFVNPRSGGGKAARARVAELARERGIEVVELARGQRLRALVDEAVERGADALGMAGGDGSLGIVPATAESHGLPFICIPAGTRNHFARDLGLDPDDPAGALKAFSDGDERWIDVGTVNGHLFLNCVSLAAPAHGSTEDSSGWSSSTGRRAQRLRRGGRGARPHWR